MSNLHQHISLTGISLNEVSAADNIESKLTAARIVPGEVPPKPEAVFAVNDDGIKTPIFTRGSISLTKGAAKSGKTGVSIIVVSTVLKSPIKASDDLGYCLQSDSAGTVIYVDCEQGSYYAAITAQRIKMCAGDCSNFCCYDFRQYNANERLLLIEAAIAREPNVALVIIDGLRDILFDFNDPRESSVVIGKLMALSVKHDCHINLILHTNKGDTNARGHAGAEATNKAETVLQVVSNKETGVTTVTGEYTRGIGFNGFAFSRDTDGVPQLLRYTPKNKMMEKNNPIEGMTDAQHTAFASVVFSGKDVLSYAELSEAIKSAFAGEGASIGTNRIKALITHWREKYVLLHNGESGRNVRYSLFDL